jgi:tRNA A37 threonylcarbamoyladenosine synthetase subunit TsaC/SUA5/YrdC
MPALLNKMIFAIPTETVYLDGNAFSEKAIKDFRIKKKTFYNPLIVHIKSVC